MDIETKLKWLDFNSWYGLYPRRHSMSEKSNNEWFVKTVENTANAAISAGRDVNEVIHDTIEILYGRKNINELLPSGWIIKNDCSECMYEYVPSGNEPCLRCYNKFFHVSDFHVSDAGPYTNNFKPTDEISPS